MSREELAFDASELAALYVTGALSPAEQAAFEARVVAGDADARRALADLAPLRDVMDASIMPVPVPASARAAIMARVAADAAAHPAAPRPLSSPDPASPLYTLRYGQTPWQETGVAGVRSRTLFVDQASKRVTVLFQLDPGSTYPDHHHGGVEECYVVEGDLHIAGTVLYAGDYHRAQPDTDHGDSYTVGGCLLLITAPAA